MAAIIRDSWCAAGVNTNIQSYERLVTDEFRNSDKFINTKYIKEMAPMLISFGTNMVKSTLATKGDRLYKKSSKLILDIYDKYHQDKQPFFIDSGGFLFTVSKVKHEYIDYLINYYTDFIKETCSDQKYDDMLYFYLDIAPTNRITYESSIESMTKFHESLKDKLKGIDGALNKIYIVMQVNNPLSYHTFYRFIHDNAIHEDLQSHKWSCGGLVPLNFNSSQYFIRPYIVALIDMIDLEYDALKNGTPVYFHVLGTSSYYELILITWLNILCKYRGINLTITTDSTSHINNANRVGALHYINRYPNEKDNHYITLIDIAYNKINKMVHNRNYRNGDYLNKIIDEFYNTLDMAVDRENVYTNDNRWTKNASCMFNVYEWWAFSRILPFIRKQCEAYKDNILFGKYRSNLKQLTGMILGEIDSSTLLNIGRTQFDLIFSKLVTSLDYFIQALNKKLPPNQKSYKLVKALFSNNEYLSTNSIINLNKDGKVLASLKK